MGCPTVAAEPQPRARVSLPSDAELLAAGARRVERIGDAVLVLGDCRSIAPTLPRPDAIVSDPPYGIGFAAQPTRYQRANGMIAVDWDDAAPEPAWLAALVGMASRVALWGGNHFALPPSRGWLAWLKQGNAPSMADFELAWTSVDMNARWFEKTVKSASLEKNLRTDAHPTQKPIGLMEWTLEQIGAERGSICLDPYMGSGTTGVACLRRGVRFIGIEIEERYFDVACKRIAEAARQPSLFDAAPQPKPQQMELGYPVEQMG